MRATKRFSFCYAHKLPLYEGKCVNVHGHTAHLEVSFDGGEEVKNKPYSGMIIDYNLIKKFVQPIVDMLDHKFLNDVMVDNPTTENLVEFIEFEIKKTPIGKFLCHIRLYESETSWIDKEVLTR